MWARIRLDIGWRDLAAGLGYCLFPLRRRSSMLMARQAWSNKDDFLITLSVRSSFDLALRAIQLPRGSEILFSAITVPDMVRIAESHGLVAVPVDTDEVGKLCLSSLEKSITSNSKMLIVAHLFGGSEPMDEIFNIIRFRDLIVVEDCAQCFQKVGAAGHNRSDLVMYSFGPIKTSTALGGGVVRVRARDLRERMSHILKQDRVQSRWSFGQRLIRFGWVKCLSSRWSLRVLRSVLRWSGQEFDSVANSLGRSFVGARSLSQFRQQASSPLLCLLNRRWKHYDVSRIKRRVMLGRFLDKRIGVRHGLNYSYWVYPLFVDNPGELVERMIDEGFDATRRNRMTVIQSTKREQQAPAAKFCWQRVVFLPWYPELPAKEIKRMANVVGQYKPAVDD